MQDALSSNSRKSQNSVGERPRDSNLLQNSMFSDNQGSKEVPSSATRVRKVDKLNEPAVVQQNTSFDTLIPDGVPEAANDSIQMLAPWPGLEAASNLNLSQNSKAILSQEMKMLRLRISDYNKSPIIDAVCQKIWKLVIVHQYDETLLKLITHPSTLPIHIDLYEMITPMLEAAMGIYHHTNYYVARQETATRYGSTNVFYPRFMYDLISMFGLNLFYIELPTLEFLLRRVYQAISFMNAEHKIQLLSLECIRPAFTEQEYLKVIHANSAKTQELTVPESQPKPNKITLNDDEEIQQEDTFTDLLAIGKQADEKRKQAKIKKLRTVKELMSLKAQQRPFEFLPSELFMKHDPVKTLAYLKKNKVFPLQAQAKPLDPNENQPELDQSEQPSQQQKSQDQPNRQHTLKVYEHLQKFCSADMEEALEFEERQKLKAKQQQLIQKLESRPEHVKMAQFLKYEQLNLKSHLYNQSTKTDKMFRELNAIQTKQPQATLGGEMSRDEEQLLKMYSPIIELKKDELASHNQSIQQILQMKQQQDSLMQASQRYQASHDYGDAIRVSSDHQQPQQRKQFQRAKPRRHESEVSSVDQQDYINQKFQQVSKQPVQAAVKPELQIQGVNASQLPAIRNYQSMQDPVTMTSPSHTQNSYRDENLRYKKPQSLMQSIDSNKQKKYALPFMKPTEASSVREHMLSVEKHRLSQDIYSSINTEASRDPVDGKVWIHDVTMGDFQLQNWRTIRKRRNNIKVLSHTVA